VSEDLLRALRRAVVPLHAPPGAAPPGTREAAVLLLGDPAVPEVPLLFVRRAEHLRQHAGQLGFPGGSREPQDTDIVATALREAAEEVGVDPAQVEVLGTLPPRLTDRSNLWLTPVVGLQRRSFRVRSDGYEVAEWFRIDLAALRSAEHRTEEWRTVGGAPRTVHFFEAGDRTIWGVTGAIVHDLLERLAGNGG
jgi:8-oxo-dGTP pyrophosphatase MutT (NUDIX family)